MSEIDYGKIDVLVLDVDGVLTDGRIVLTGDGDEIKRFHVRDGAGMKYWKRLGKKLVIITGRGSPAVSHRAKELDVDVLRMNAKDKLPVLKEILAELDIPADRVAAMGDDLTDIPVLRHCGLSAAPCDASQEVLDIVHHVTRHQGGAGAVREVIELILKGAGRWEQVLSRYLPSAGPSGGKGA